MIHGNNKIALNKLERMAEAHPKCSDAQEPSK
jgi:hypothetical protein